MKMFMLKLLWYFYAQSNHYTMRWRQWIAIIIISVIYTNVGFYTVNSLLKLISLALTPDMKVTSLGVSESIAFTWNIVFMWGFCAVIAAVVHRVSDRLTMLHYAFTLLLCTSGALAGLFGRMLFLRNKYSSEKGFQIADNYFEVAIPIKSIEPHTWGIAGAVLFAVIYLYLGNRKKTTVSSAS